MTDHIFLSIPDAARRLSVSRSTLYEILKEGAIRSVKVGHLRLVDAASLSEWAASLPTSLPSSAAQAKG